LSTAQLVDAPQAGERSTTSCSQGMGFPRDDRPKSPASPASLRDVEGKPSAPSTQQNGAPVVLVGTQLMPASVITDGGAPTRRFRRALVYVGPALQPEMSGRPAAKLLVESSRPPNGRHAGRPRIGPLRTSISSSRQRKFRETYAADVPGCGRSIPGRTRSSRLAEKNARAAPGLRRLHGARKPSYGDP